MTREELNKTVLSLKDRHFILELATGYGKTKLALDVVNKWGFTTGILIVVPRLVLIKDWQKEIIKWGYNKKLNIVKFVTYASLHKMIGSYNIVIFDEAHHLSDKKKKILLDKKWKIQHCLFLSATISIKTKSFIYSTYKGTKLVNINMQNAINDGVLAKPELISVELTLDNTNYNKIIERKAKDNNLRTIEYSYDKYYLYKNYKGGHIIHCTARQYYNYISDLIEWYKSKARNNKQMEKVWLFKCKQRLDFLAEEKTEQIRKLVKERKERFVVFTANINQSEQLNIPCVNSKIGTENLELFNNQNINSIAVVGMIDEGCNLNNCELGVFQMINSSTRLIIQRIGRIMRHQHPKLMFVYYKNTREEEIVKEIINSYS